MSEQNGDGGPQTNLPIWTYPKRRVLKLSSGEAEKSREVEGITEGWSGCICRLSAELGTRIAADLAGAILVAAVLTRLIRCLLTSDVDLDHARYFSRSWWYFVSDLIYRGYMTRLHFFSTRKRTPRLLRIARTMGATPPPAQLNPSPTCSHPSHDGLCGMMPLR